MPAWIQLIVKRNKILQTPTESNGVIHELTSYRYYTLKIILKDFKGETKFAEYSAFKMDDEAHNYRLTVNGYSGTADDAMAYHNGVTFSTYDKDGVYHCARDSNGGWWYQYRTGGWYKFCHNANLNGRYYHNKPGTTFGAVSWYQWGGYESYLEETTMVIKRQ